MMIAKNLCLQLLILEDLIEQQLEAINEDDDCKEIYDYLLLITEDFKSKFNMCYNTSKVLENLQGLID